MDSLITFAGRFHPLLVHFPIGILILAYGFELLSIRSRFLYLKPAVLPSLFLGVLFSLLTALTGYILSLEGGYGSQLLSYHRWTGISTAVLALIVLIVKRRLDKNLDNSLAKVYIFLFTLLIFVLTVAGHLGASLTHGEDFLSAYTPWNSLKETEEFTFPEIDDIETAALYPDIIDPIFSARCYSCHSASKQKGDLRLDGMTYILTGGKSQKTIIPNNADSSEIFKRLILPPEDEHHMPPNERTQLSAVEISIIQLWIDDGADFSVQVKDLREAQKMKNYWQFWQSSVKSEGWVPSTAVEKINSNSVEQLNKFGIQLIPFSRGNGYVHVNFLNTDTVNNEILQSLGRYNKQIISMKLNDMALGLIDYSFLSNLNQLRKLDLSGSILTEQDLELIGNLPELRFLNLVATQVNDQGLEILQNSKKLDQLFLFQNDISVSGLKDFLESNPGVEVDTGGYFLPVLASDTIVYQ